MILVTGANGYIGSVLMKEIKYNVIGIDNFIKGKRKENNFKTYQKLFVDKNINYVSCNSGN
jgi:nucleoside-diphosphate-sugar epimerase